MSQRWFDPKAIAVGGTASEVLVSLLAPEIRPLYRRLATARSLDAGTYTLLTKDLEAPGWAEVATEDRAIAPGLTAIGGGLMLDPAVRATLLAEKEPTDTQYLGALLEETTARVQAGDLRDRVRARADRLYYLLRLHGDAAVPELVEQATTDLNTWNLQAVDALLAVVDDLGRERAAPEHLNAALDPIRRACAQRRFWHEDRRATWGYVRRHTDDELDAWIARPDSRWLLHVSAPGGRGKSTWIRRAIVEGCLPKGLVPVRIDFDDIPDPLAALSAPDEFAGRIVRQLAALGYDQEVDHLRMGAPPEKLAEAIGPATQLILWFDTVERVTARDARGLAPLLAWLRALHSAHPGVRACLVGRGTIPTTPIPPTEVFEVELKSLDEKESTTFLEARGVPRADTRLAALAEVGQGLPLRLLLLVDLFKANPGIGEREIRETSSVEIAILAQRVLLHISEGARWLLRYGTLPRQLTRAFAEQVIVPLLREHGDLDDGVGDFPAWVTAESPFRKLSVDPALHFPEWWENLCGHARISAGWIREAGPGRLILEEAVRAATRELLLRKPIFSLLVEKTAVFRAAEPGSPDEVAAECMDLVRDLPEEAQADVWRRLTELQASPDRRSAFARRGRDAGAAIPASPDRVADAALQVLRKLGDPLFFLARPGTTAAPRATLRELIADGVRFSGAKTLALFAGDPVDEEELRIEREDVRTPPLIRAWAWLSYARREPPAHLDALTRAVAAATEAQLEDLAAFRLALLRGHLLEGRPEDAATLLAEWEDRGPLGQSVSLLAVEVRRAAGEPGEAWGDPVLAAALAIGGADETQTWWRDKLGMSEDPSVPFRLERDWSLLVRDVTAYSSSVEGLLSVVPSAERSTVALDGAVGARRLGALQLAWTLLSDHVLLAPPAGREAEVDALGRHLAARGLRDWTDRSDAGSYVPAAVAARCALLDLSGGADAAEATAALVRVPSARVRVALIADSGLAKGQLAASRQKLLPELASVLDAEGPDWVAEYTRARTWLALGAVDRAVVPPPGSDAQAALATELAADGGSAAPAILGSQATHPFLDAARRLAAARIALASGAGSEAAQALSPLEGQALPDSQAATLALLFAELRPDERDRWTAQAVADLTRAGDLRAAAGLTPTTAGDDPEPAIVRIVVTTRAVRVERGMVVELPVPSDGWQALTDPAAVGAGTTAYGERLAGLVWGALPRVPEATIRIVVQEPAAEGVGWSWLRSSSPTPRAVTRLGAPLTAGAPPPGDVVVIGGDGTLVESAWAARGARIHAARSMLSQGSAPSGLAYLHLLVELSDEDGSPAVTLSSRAEQGRRAWTARRAIAILAGNPRLFLILHLNTRATGEGLGRQILLRNRWAAAFVAGAPGATVLATGGEPTTRAGDLVRTLIPAIVDARTVEEIPSRIQASSPPDLLSVGFATELFTSLPALPPARLA